MIDAAFHKHGSDKGSWSHCYNLFYDTLTDIKSVLEVGVAGGASLLSWAEAWPEAEIWGIDLQRGLHWDQLDANPKIHTVLHNATDPGIVDRLPPLSFDLIVDDGSHMEGDQLNTFDLLFLRLSRTGFYVIEDIQRLEYAHQLQKWAEERGFTARVLVTAESPQDSRLVVIRPRFVKE